MNEKLYVFQFLSSLKSTPNKKYKVVYKYQYNCYNIPLTKKTNFQVVNPRLYELEIQSKQFKGKSYGGGGRGKGGGGRGGRW